MMSELSLFHYAVPLSIFLGLVFVLIFYLKSVSDEKVARYFSSRTFKSAAAISISIVISLILFLAFQTLSENKRTVKKTVQQRLEFILNETKIHLDIWVHEKENFLKQLGRDPQLVKLVKKLKLMPSEKSVLVSSNEQKEIRDFFKKRESELGDIGYFIINENYVSLASKRDSNIGSQNLISIHKPELLKQAFAGKAVFIPPIPSDVNLETDQLIETNQNAPYTMFLAAPVQDESGKVLAVITKRLNVTGELSKILHLGWSTGSSGESYLFNEQGFLLTESRFKEDLVKIGLIKPDEKEYQKIQIKDPGGNLLKGYEPNVPMEQQPLTYMVKDAIALSKNLTESYSEINSNTSGYRDYRGSTVYGAWLWSKNYGFGITAEIDKDEALESYISFRTNLLIITFISLLLTIVATSLLIILANKATRSVQKANKKLNKLLDSFDENVIALKADLNGNITYVSNALCKMSGYSKEELIGNSHTFLKDPETSEAFLENLLRHVKQEEIWRGESRNQNSEGEFYWVYSIVTPEYDTDKNLIGYSDIKNDITAKKEVENLSEEMSNLLDSFDENVIALKADLNGNITYVSNALCKMSGYSKEELIGNSHTFLKDPETSEAFLENLLRHVKQEEIWRGESRNQNSEGEFYWVYSIVTPEYDTDKNLIGYSDIKNDITAKKEVENLSKSLELKVEERTKEVKSSGEQLQYAMDASGDGIWDWDIANETIKHNRSWVEILKYDESYLEHNMEFFAQTIFEEDRDEVFAKVNLAMEQNQDYASVHRMLASDGEVIWVQDRGRVVQRNSEGKALRMVGSMVDITARKEAEEELRRNLDELERFNKLSVGRELKMIELKKEVNELMVQLDRDEKYKIR